MVRYADDFAVLCRTQEEAPTVRAWLRPWTTVAGLSLHPIQARLVNAAEEGFDFLGWTFGGAKNWLRKKGLQKLQEQLRSRTQRTGGQGLSEVIAKANPMLRGGHGSCRGSYWTGLRRPERWLRRRLGGAAAQGGKSGLAPGFCGADRRR